MSAEEQKQKVAMAVTCLALTAHDHELKLALLSPGSYHLLKELSHSAAVLRKLVV